MSLSALYLLEAYQLLQHPVARRSGERESLRGPRVVGALSPTRGNAVRKPCRGGPPWPTSASRQVKGCGWARSWSRHAKVAPTWSRFGAFFARKIFVGRLPRLRNTDRTGGSQV